MNREALFVDAICQSDRIRLYTSTFTRANTIGKILLSRREAVLSLFECSFDIESTSASGIVHVYD